MKEIPLPKGFEIANYIEVDYNILEKFIKEHLGFEYEIPYMEERSNDTNLIFQVEDNMDDHEEDDIANIKSGKNPGNWMLGCILDYMCSEKLLPKGSYLVNVSW